MGLIMGGIGLFRSYKLISGAWQELNTGDFALSMGQFPGKYP